MWLAPRVVKMTQFARCDWLPERPRWSHLAPSGLPAVSCKHNFPKSHIMNPLLTKFVRSRWLDLGCSFFCEFMDLFMDLCQYPAILTSHLVNNPYGLLFSVVRLKTISQSLLLCFFAFGRTPYPRF